MTETQRHYLPAAGHDWALPLYDPLVALLGVGAIRKAVVDGAALRRGMRVLDVGCGTGTLAVLIKQRHPDVDVTGVDPDPRALARARRKAERAAVGIRVDVGFADRLPYDDGSFDRIFSSFMFHHLRAEDRLPMLVEARRVLKPGGSLHLVDFARTGAGAGGWLARLFHSSEHLVDNTDSRMLALMRAAGLENATRALEATILFGGMTVACYQAGAPLPAQDAGGR